MSHSHTAIYTAALSAFVLVLASGCGPSTNDAVQADQREYAGTGDLVVSPEVKKLDDSMANLETRTDAMFTKVQSLEHLVADKMIPEDLEALRLGVNSDRAYIEISEQGVLRVNGIAMTLNEISAFATAQAKAICQPPPTVVVDPQANYDLVASVIEILYGQGCANVEVVQQDPSKVKGNH